MSMQRSSAAWILWRKWRSLVNCSSYSAICLKISINSTSFLAPSFFIALFLGADGFHAAFGTLRDLRDAHALHIMPHDLHFACAQKLTVRPVASGVKHRADQCL